MTTTRTSNWLRGNVLGLVAIFIALGGTAYATHPGGANTISSGDIINGEVRNGDIGNLEVRANNIAPDSLGGGKIANQSVKNADLSTGASSSNTIADGGIQGVDVKANTLTGTQIDELALDFAVLQQRVADACPAGEAIRAVAQSGAVTCEGVGAAGSFWSLGGNSGTTGTDFLGTTDNNPFNLRVNDARALRLEPASDGTNQSPNVIGGIADNSVTAGVHSATIGGGGRNNPADPATANRVTDHQGTVGGGANNQAGDGFGTVSDRPLATVGGGEENRASGGASTVAGGQFNTAAVLRSFVGGGIDNFAGGGEGATIAGGRRNIVGAAAGTVAGGSDNNASGFASIVGGGGDNTASGNRATVPGGTENTASGFVSLAAGRGAQANHDGAFVWADSNNFDFASSALNQFNVRSTGGARLVSGIDGSGSPTSGFELPAGTSAWSTLVNGQPFDLRVSGARGLRIDPASDGTNQSPNVIGGIADNSVTAGVHSAAIGGGGRRTAADPATANRVTDDYGTVGGGGGNQAGDGAGTTSDRRFTTVGGGVNNTASGNLATVGGGTSNTASGQDATVAGGGGNTAGGFVAAVPGGQSNSAMGDYSLAAGRRAKANHQGAFVWADSQFSDIASTANNQFIARAAPGFFLTSNSVLPEDQGLINTSAGADASGQNGAFLSSAGVWTDVSDENKKEGFAAVEPNEVLAKLAELPVRSWQYKAEPGVRHIGPVAQDFHRAFGLGADDRHIASLDTSGVALAAIKGLEAENERLSSKLRAERRARLKHQREFEAQRRKFEARLAALEREDR